MEPGSSQQIIGLTVLLLLSTFFSASETALTTISRLRLRNMVDEGVKGALKVHAIVESPKKLLSTILVGNNLVNIMASAVATSLAIKLSGNNSVAIGISTGLLTFIILVFCEITPKTYATQNAEKLSLLVSGPIGLCVKILTPVVYVLTFLTSLIIRLFGGDTTDKNPVVTEAELKTMVNVSKEEGVLKDEEQEIINNVFDFGGYDAKDVMTPRTDVVAVPVDATYEQVKEVFLKERFSRLPVYRETTDDIVGILHLKDIAFTDNLTKDFNVENHMRKPFFTYESKPTGELFATMRTKFIPIAVVLDEYGGTSGIVTLEDLIEEIVGDIADEYDDEEEDLVLVSENEYVARGDVKIDDVNDAMGIHIQSEDFDSIGGYVMGIMGRIPEKGETIDDNIDETIVTFIVEEVDKNRIERLRMMKNNS